MRVPLETLGVEFERVAEAVGQPRRSEVVERLWAEALQPRPAAIRPAGRAEPRQGLGVSPRVSYSLD